MKRIFFRSLLILLTTLAGFLFSRTAVATTCSIELDSSEKKITFTSRDSGAETRLTRTENGREKHVNWMLKGHQQLRREIEKIAAKHSSKAKANCASQTLIRAMCDGIKEISTCSGAKENADLIALLNAVNLDFVRLVGK